MYYSNIVYVTFTIKQRRNNYAFIKTLSLHAHMLPILDLNVTIQTNSLSFVLY